MKNIKNKDMKITFPREKRKIKLVKNNVLYIILAGEKTWWQKKEELKKQINYKICQIGICGQTPMKNIKNKS